MLERVEHPSRTGLNGKTPVQSRSNLFNPVLANVSAVQQVKIMGQSLSAYCRAKGLSKGSASNFLKGQGFETRHGLTRAAIAALDAKYPTQAEVVEAEIEAVDGQLTRIDSTANPLVPIHIGTLNLNIHQANTGQLEAETAQFHQVSAAALQGIGQFIQADLTSTVQSAVAQNRHAVAGLNAQAAANLANGLGKPQGSGGSQA